MSTPRRAFFVFAALVLLASVLLLGSAISQAAPAERLRRDICLVAIAVLGLGTSFLKTAPRQPSHLDRIVAWCAILLPCYALLQIVPLPVPLVALLSPARAGVLNALAPVAGPPGPFASLSNVPGVTFTHFVLISGYSVVFFFIRALARADGYPGWIFAAPIVLAAILEALAGFAQFSEDVDAQVGGTYAIKNHFAGLLAMALPFVVAWLIGLAQAARRDRERSAALAFRFGAGLIAAVLLLLGIALSRSRGGFVAAIATGVVLVVMALPAGMSARARLLAFGAAGLTLLAALFYLTPLVLVQRLADHTSTGRIPIWENTLHLIAAYPLVGCGLGGYESAILQFKTTALMNDLDYAHNDYLQYLAEMGLAGFAIAATLLAGLLVRAVKAAGGASFPPGATRWLAVGCTGAFAAILTHSMFDFNLYVPANAIVLAWIAGLTAALPVASPEEAVLPDEFASAVRSRSMQFR
jgi:O-antigen ligase